MIYSRRYENEPRKREIYVEACDLIMVYGLPRNYINYKGKVNREELKEIWNFAVADSQGKSAYCFCYEGGGEMMRDFSKGILIPILVILMMFGIVMENDAVANVVMETNITTMIEP